MALELLIGKGWQNFEVHNRRNLDCLEIRMLKVPLVGSQTETADKLLDTGQKSDPYYKVAENLAKLFSTIGRKVELVSDELS